MDGNVPYDKRENPIVELTFKFSLRMIEFCEALYMNKQFNLSRQLFRSATSIGANVKEAQNAESRADFIHKMKISMKGGRDRILVAVMPELQKLSEYRAGAGTIDVDSESSL